MNTKRLIFIIAFMLLPSLGWAANKYVLQGASGSANGTDWTNAYVTLPAVLTRGDTYYMGDGTYIQYAFDDVESGTLVITIKKATIADHGTETGWNNTFGDGQAIFDPNIQIERSYTTIDGNSTTSYGFAIYPTDVILAGIRVKRNSGTNDNIVLKSISIDGSVHSAAEPRGILFAAPVSNITVSRVEVHSIQDDCMSLNGATTVLIEYFHCYDRRFGAGKHGDAIENGTSTDVTIRYSIFDWDGQQLWFNSTTGTYYIYGNLHYGGITSGKGIHIQDQFSPTIGPLYVYNNTFANLYLGLSTTAFTTAYVYNNIYYNLVAPQIYVGVTHDYNYFGGGISTGGEAHAQVGPNPFINDAAGDFHMIGATDAGDNTIGSTYNTDRDSVVRGADGLWDRGAYEFGNSTPTIVPQTGARSHGIKGLFWRTFK